ncbi:PDZ domain-containing protein [Chitinophaga arvensicola]|uniref:PDZ domain-containing protein n=1 Tax=Chitinophaga arvensicola TaxID=29529 RepID=A0A1I0PY86_9BACT|nr:PDZ domain-containing protein [Chitinophaga arvensicola]SEW19532.1 PDZ domain-containing protein [Chitinophaga arvensicola]
MTRLLQILTIAGFSCFTMSAVSAQTKNQLGEFDEIVIKHKSNKDGKVTVEIKNGDILINGKKMDDYNDPDLSVFRRKITPRDGNALSFDNRFPGGSIDLFNEEDGDEDDIDIPALKNRAVLGVITEKAAATGVTVKSVAKGTPAEKAGIKTGDIITSVDDKKINEPAELFEVIGKYQPADKVTVTYIRNSKTNKVAITLDERKEIDNSWNSFPPLSAPPKNGPRSFSFPMPRGGQGFGDSWYNRMDNGVKLGLQVQDTEKENGAQVIEVDPSSPAAGAGIQKDDIVLEFAGTPVKNVADLSKAFRENRDKGDVQAKVSRNGNTQTVNIKLPKKLNKANI